jgi:GNAT superfamily N-acetyltransferase
MSLALHLEDPGAARVDRAQVIRTLDVFRTEPHRGRAAVAEMEGIVRAYALLVPFWSNELGGCVCQIDELYVEDTFRNRGVGASLFDAIERDELFESERFIALALGVTDPNARARALYERLGFRSIGTSLVRMH